jgi:alpha-glucosidase
MRYILDIVPNHCGYWHPWFQRARQDKNAPESEFFTFTRHPEEYASWLGVWSLPKLNYRSAELRRRMYRADDSIFRRWLKEPFRADGWRLDVANMLGRQGATQLGVEVAREIRQAVKHTAPQAYLIGENFFDATLQLQGDQWDGVMNYMGFATPLLHWLRGFWAGSWGLKDAVNSPVAYPTASLAATWRMRQSSIPWSVAQQQYNLLGSHDTPRVRSQVHGNDALHRLAVALLLTFPGVPGLYYGDEIGMTDVPALGQRGCMEWDANRWDHSLLDFHKDLIALRKRSPILQRGGFQIVAAEEDLLAFQRENWQGRILVIAQRSAQPRPAGSLPIAHAGVPDGARFREHFSGVEALVSNGHLPLPELPQGASIWESI